MTESKLTLERLDTLIAERRNIDRETARIQDQIAAIDRQAAPSQQAVAQVQSLQQERRGVFARLLRRGEPVTAGASEVAELDRRLDNAQGNASTSQAVLEAASELRAELEVELHQTSSRLPALQRDVDLARYDAGRAELEERSIPEFLEALEAFRQAWARLHGHGVANCRMAAALRDRYEGLPVKQSIGTGRPDAVVQLAVMGFDIEERLRGHPTLRGWNYSGVLLDVGEAIEHVAQAAQKRWSEAGA